MKGNRELDELLISYILKELNAEEEALVAEHIDSDENNRRHFEELQNVWRLLAVKQELDKVDVNNEWQNFEFTVAREKQKLISIRKQQESEEKQAENIIYEDNFHKRSATKKILVSLAIAASVITLIFFAWDFLNNARDQKKVASAVSSDSNSVVVLIRHETNISAKPRKLLLKDGSEIILSPKSEVSYDESFAGNRRDITLKGKAEFKVAKDKTKPFTVYSLAIATTALGTHFTVSAFENAENISVRLYEGKVVVKSAAYVTAKLKRDYYLLPGQELIYNHKKNKARLLNFNLKSPVPQENISENFTDDPGLPENNKGSWYMFNNQSLAEVFDQLKVIYNVDIVYSKKAVQNKYFIGRYDKSDSLYTILSQIASLNNFKLTKKNNRFIISK